jgi:hypothetical protein
VAQHAVPTLCRELLERISIVGESHLALVLREYMTHYNGCGLACDPGRSAARIAGS